MTCCGPSGLAVRGEEKGLEAERNADAQVLKPTRRAKGRAWWLVELLRGVENSRKKKAEVPGTRQSFRSTAPTCHYTFYHPGMTLTCAGG